MPKPQSDPARFVRAIQRSGLSIYDPIEVGHPELWIPSPELQALLDHGFRGFSVLNLPLRTRSKVIKQNICRVLGYPVPESFRKTKPRFPGQFFDTYAQESNNLQVWNDEIAPVRRYVVLRISPAGNVERVRVVTGDTLASLDQTGRLTQKYQARCLPTDRPAELVSTTDTDRLAPLVSATVALAKSANPVNHPAKGELLPIAVIFERLKRLIGQSFADAGADQDRNRGAALHALVCRALGYRGFQDDGRFPDVRHQLLEVKLQTSPTIDLGLVTPDSDEPLDVPQIEGTQVRHRDVRYAVVYGITNGKTVALTNLYLCTGEAFFNRFPRFGGKVLNKKLQIPLPADFFNR